MTSLERALDLSRARARRLVRRLTAFALVAAAAVTAQTSQATVRSWHGAATPGASHWCAQLESVMLDEVAAASVMSEGRRCSNFQREWSDVVGFDSEGRSVETWIISSSCGARRWAIGFDESTGAVGVKQLSEKSQIL